MKENFIKNVHELLEDWKSLLVRWNQVKHCEMRRKKFCVRNRNPLFDISKNSFFFTGLGSVDGLNSDKPVLDHFIQRAKAVELIFEFLDKNPQLDTFSFLKVLKKYCSVVKLTKNEHSKVTTFCKSNQNILNFEAYEACGIKIHGLSKIILQN